MRHRLFALVATVGLLSTACGARLNDAQYIQARGAGGGTGTAAGTGRTGTGTGTGATGTGTGAGDTTGGGGGTGTGGTGGTDGSGGTAAGGGSCSPTHTDAPGVTDTEIKLGNISTISGPVPNFGATGRAGAKAYLDFVNSQGGVCGRKLSLQNGDDRLDPGINRSQTDQMKDSVFGFVGNTTVEDDGGAGVIGGTNIPNCSLIIGNEALKQPNYYSPNPIDPTTDTNGTTPIWNWMKANKGITKVGIVFPDNPNAAARITGYRKDIAAAGLVADPIIKVAVTETNYVGVATQMKNAGDDSFITVLEVNGISKLAQAIKQVGWTPKAPYYGAQAYGPQLPQLAGDAANGALIGLTHDIVEGGSAEMTTFAQFYKASSSGQPLDFFAIMGWSAARMCVDAIAAAGPAPTRDAVIAALNATTDFTAGGILASRNPGGKKGTNQFVIVTIEGGVWKRVYPESGFRDRMTAAVDWFKGIRTKPTRLIPVALVLFYVFRVWTTAGDTGQLFSFTMIGIAEGCLFAIAASGLVLTYATTGVFNFAHGAVGMVSAYVYFALTVQHGVPAPIGVLIVLLVFAPLVGLGTERVMRSFRDESVQTTVVVTIALFVMCIGLAQKFWPPETGARLDPLIKGDTIHIWEANLTRDNILAIVLAVVVALVLRSLLFVSRTGVAMRAVVDNPTLAALNGAPPIAIARYSWILGSTLAALSGILLASNGSSLDPIVLTLFVAGAYGAAVVGKLKSLPLTFGGAIALGVMKQHATFALFPSSGWQSVRIAIPGIFLFAALLLVPAAKLSVGRIVGSRTPKVPSLPSSVVRSAVFVGVMIVVANVTPASRLFDVTTALVYALLLLSLVLLTGYSGQISLCQYVFLAMGAWAMGTFFGGHSVFGILVAGLVAIPLGVIVSLPALRLQGLYLALVTFGFASIAGDLLLKNDHFYGSASVNVGRLHFLGIKFDDDRAFLVLCAIVFVVFAVGLLTLRRGQFGRRLATLRDSQAAYATLGLDVRRTKLAVFVVSAYVAGVAGAMFGSLKATADAIQFEPLNNVVLLLFAVVGGVTTVTGALMGGALFALLPFIQSEYPDQGGLVFAAVAVAVVALGRQPNGLAGMLYEAVTGRGKPGRAATDTTPRNAAPGKAVVGASA